ncbi:TPA: tail fiber protein [Yersinia enterocolitica]|nr:tail fiber protein [Yersinia enterocolitica]
MPVKQGDGIFKNVGLGGLGIGSALPVGVPVPWPTATPPTGWIKCNGAPFSATTYPQLAVIFPSLVLPDLRGEFIRGWDDGRGIDVGRTLLSDQLGTFVSVDINYADNGLVGAIGTTDGTGGIANVNGDTITTPLTKTAFQYAAVSGLGASTSLPGNTVATRPRNVAFNYIVRAA